MTIFRYVPPIGEATFEIDVDPSLSPSFTLLVFYVRDDKETVADSHKFEVEKCFKNKVWEHYTFIGFFYRKYFIIVSLFYVTNVNSLTFQEYISDGT